MKHNWTFSYWWSIGLRFGVNYVRRSHQIDTAVIPRTFAISLGPLVLCWTDQDDLQRFYRICRAVREAAEAAKAQANP